MHQTMTGDNWATCVNINGRCIIRRSSTGRLVIKTNYKQRGSCTVSEQESRRHESIKASIVIAAYNTIS
jgi:hypothetical protein